MASLAQQSSPQGLLQTDPPARRIACPPHLQIGCFVPASFCSLCPVDKIFTRIGTHDCLETNSSSFMVEMQVLLGLIRMNAHAPRCPAAVLRSSSGQ